MDRIDVFIESLKVMGMGMTGIFIFMSAFFGVIVGLNKLFPAVSDKED